MFPTSLALLEISKVPDVTDLESLAEDDACKDSYVESNNRQFC